MRLPAFLLAAGSVTLVEAAEPLSKAPAPSLASSPSGQLAQLLLGLLLVLGLIFLLAWLVRRLQQVVPRSSGQIIQLLASQPLGPRERLLLVQVGSEQILLGLTPGTIVPLHVLTQPVTAPQAQPATPEFAQRLMELLGKNPKEPNR